MRTLFIVIIVLGAIGIFEGAVYRSVSNPMGFHPTRGLVIILVGVVFVIGGIAGLIMQARKRRA